MAVSYLELERRNPTGQHVEIGTNGVLIFDTIVSNEGLGQINYDLGTGIITFLEAGFYYIDWYTAPYFGLTTDGSNWAIRTSISGQSFIGSSHTKVSITTGFAIINAVTGETARLVNVSDGAIFLSQAVRSKAGLIVYSVANMSLSGV